MSYEDEMQEYHEEMSFRRKEMENIKKNLYTNFYGNLLLHRLVSLKPKKRLHLMLQFTRQETILKKWNQESILLFQKVLKL